MTPIALTRFQKFEFVIYNALLYWVAVDQHYYIIDDFLRVILNCILQEIVGYFRLLTGSFVKHDFHSY